jgi:hypothetical protein
MDTENIPKLPLSLLYQVYFYSRDKIYRVQEGGTQEAVSEKEMKKIRLHNWNNQIRSLHIYDYWVSLTKDVWEADPGKIELDKLDFLYEYQFIGEDDFMRFRLLKTIP